jgi:hypothetical protein
MGEITRDIKGLPNPQTLHAAKLERDRDKLYGEREKMSGVLEAMQQHIMEDIEKSNGTDTIVLYKSIPPLSNLQGFEPESVKEAMYVLRRWLDMYGYKLVQGQAIVPIRPGILGWFVTQVHCHIARCNANDGWGIATGLGAMFGFIMGMIFLCRLIVLG